MFFELSNVFIDKKKMDLVSELIDVRPNLRTVILNIDVLTYAPSFLADWLFRLNRLKLKFLIARKIEDIENAFNKLDSDQDGKISTVELSAVCGYEAVKFWNYKYGPHYKVKHSISKFCDLNYLDFFFEMNIQGISNKIDLHQG